MDRLELTNSPTFALEATPIPMVPALLMPATAPRVKGAPFELRVPVKFILPLTSSENDVFEDLLIPTVPALLIPGTAPGLIMTPFLIKSPL